MKALRYVLMGSLMSLSTCAAAPAYADTLRTQIYDQMLSPVVQINRNCSATIIESKRDKEGVVSTFLLTAKHCTDGSKLHQEVYIPVYKNNRIIKEDLYRATVKREFYNHDLAVIKLVDDETVFKNVVLVAPKDTVLFEGEDVWTVGWSRGEVRTMTSGVFGNLQLLAFPTPTKEFEYYRATPQIAGGNSGGALFHRDSETNEYKLIGVTSAGNSGSDFMGYYVPLEAIREFLSTAVPETFKDKTTKKHEIKISFGSN